MLIKREGEGAGHKARRAIGLGLEKRQAEAERRARPSKRERTLATQLGNSDTPQLSPNHTKSVLISSISYLIRVCLCTYYSSYMSVE